MDEACALLLPLVVAACAGETVVLLLDALDEADPPEQQRADYDRSSGCVAPAGNKALHLVIAHLSKLPPNFRLIVTTRPDAVLGDVMSTLSRTFGGSLCRVSPHELRLDSKMAQSQLGRGEGDGGGGAEAASVVAAAEEEGAESAGATVEHNLVYDTVAAECGLGGAAPRPAAPGLADVYAAYAAVFAAAPPPAADAATLLATLVAAQEPLPLALLEQMGLGRHLGSLPGWGVLFYDSEHRVYTLHKSLIDWLHLEQDRPEGQGHGLGAWRASAGAGHAALARHLCEHEVAPARDSEAASGVEAGGVEASDYALKYAAAHLCAAVSLGDVAAAGMLDAALGNWPFLRQV